jgi:hypothetical protein
MQRAPTHASWVGQVERLLAGCGACSAEDRERVRALVCAEASFVWTSRP